MYTVYFDLFVVLCRLNRQPTIIQNFLKLIMIFCGIFDIFVCVYVSCQNRTDFLRFRCICIWFWSLIWLISVVNGTILVFVEAIRGLDDRPIPGLVLWFLIIHLRVVTYCKCKSAENLDGGVRFLVRHPIFLIEKY